MNLGSVINGLQLGNAVDVDIRIRIAHSNGVVLLGTGNGNNGQILESTNY